MNKIRWLKFTVLLGIPCLALLYAYQFTGQEREEIVPFKPFRIDFKQLKGFEESKTKNNSEKPLELLTEADLVPIELPLKTPITLVNFWATWCPPCVEEFPAMLELQRRLEGQGVDIVFVSIDENWEDVRGFFSKHGLKVEPHRLYWDPERKLSTAWGTDKFPESYVIRSDYWVVERIVGLQQWTRPAVLEYFEKLAKKYQKLSVH